MKTIRIAKGENFIQKGERLKNLYVLLQGNVQALYKTDIWDMEPGSVVGIPECNSDTYLCDYRTVTDCVMYAYDYTQPQDFNDIFNSDKKYVSIFVMAAMKQTAFFLKRYENYYNQAQGYYGLLMSMYQEYQRFCQDYNSPEHGFKRMEIAKPFVPEHQIHPCIISFYEKMGGMSMKAIESFLESDVCLGTGEILNGAGWIEKTLNLIEDVREYLVVQKELLICRNEDDLYHRYVELVIKAFEEGLDVQPLRETISKIMEYGRSSQLYDNEWLNLVFEKYENHDFIDQGLAETNIWEEPFQEETSENYLEQILAFGEYQEPEKELFLSDIQTFKSLSDVYSTTDEVRSLRKRLTTSFYEIYEKVLRKALDGQDMPSAIRMFLNFGFMDLELAGEDATKSLNTMVEQLNICKADNVYTIYEWLLSIYYGENEPSKNEFDLDYAGYLNELKKTGKITEAEANELQADAWKKVKFELENMFMSNSKMTYGKISTFCPILCEHDIISSMENMLVTAEKINGALDYIRGIDFSVFYRKVIFSDPKRDINMEMIEKEVLPNIILMPNAGSRAIMWQETAGIKKDTPARFIFPILTVANVREMMIEAAGRYRWEMCRKVQGVRWNDVTDPSLTSEFSDYIQYYRKNHDLSADAKEKVKNALYKSKNNFREVFVRDYQNWINYEAKGSFRLNKVSRELLFKYCPFSRNIRQELKINPMYMELFERYDIKNERAKKRLELLYDRYQKKGGEITRALQDNLNFYDL